MASVRGQTGRRKRRKMGVKEEIGKNLNGCIVKVHKDVGVLPGFC